MSLDYPGQEECLGKFLLGFGVLSIVYSHLRDDDDDVDDLSTN